MWVGKCALEFTESRIQNYKRGMGVKKVIELIIGRLECRPPSINAHERLVYWSTELWSQVLQQHVSENGRVSYETIQDDHRFLKVVEYIGRCSPLSMPDEFPTDASKLSFWINAYNILTLWGVVSCNLQQSVHDLQVSNWLRINQGQDFFVALRFMVGGTWMNLYDLENTIIRGFADGRIHAAINCASNGCPILSQQPYIADKLDDMLTDSMTFMVNSTQHLFVSRDQRTVYASQIFKWYLKDFGARRKQDLFDYWLQFSDDSLSNDLQEAQRSLYEIQWMDYDWGLNSV